MEIAKLIEWNPWWENEELINDLAGKFRPQYKNLLNSVDVKEVTIITGIRRSGKSTLMYQIIQNLLRKGITPNQILFVNLEDKKIEKVRMD